MWNKSIVNEIELEEVEFIIDSLEESKKKGNGVCYKIESILEEWKQLKRIKSLDKKIK